MRFIALISILVVATAAWAEDGDSETKLTYKAEKAVESYDKAVEKARQEYLEEVQDAQADLRKDLEKEITAVTRKGDLEGALAIKNKLDELLADEEVKTDFLGNVIEEEKKSNAKKGSSNIIGVWIRDWKNVKCVFNDDGTGSWNNGEHTFTWTQDSNTVTINMDGADVPDKIRKLTIIDENTMTATVFNTPVKYKKSQ